MFSFLHRRAHSTSAPDRPCGDGDVRPAPVPAPAAPSTCERAAVQSAGSVPRIALEAAAAGDAAGGNGGSGGGSPQRRRAQSDAAPPADLVPPVGAGDPGEEAGGQDSRNRGLEKQNTFLRYELKTRTAQHKEETAGLRDELAGLHKTLGILNRDREALTSEVISLRATNAREQKEWHAERDKMAGHIQQLERTVAQLQEEARDYNAMLLSGNEEAAAAQSLERQSMSRELQEHFSLPPTEIIVTCYSCMHSYVNGWLYVTLHYLAYESWLKRESDMLLVPLTDIVEIKKANWMWFVYSSGLEFKLKNGKTLYFSAFLSQSKAAKNIMLQAERLNHRIAYS